MIIKSLEKIMIDPEKDSSVVRWLIENSKHPYKALDLWAMLSTHLVSYVIPQTGEIATQIMLGPVSA